MLLAIIIVLYAHFANFSYRGMLIHAGVLFGSTMAFNVWFRIWPAQQKIIRAVKEGAAPDANLVKLAGLRSRHNTYMSVPLVWTMIGQHTTYFCGRESGHPERVLLHLVPADHHHRLAPGVSVLQEGGQEFRASKFKVSQVLELDRIRRGWKSASTSPVDLTVLLFYRAAITSGDLQRKFQLRFCRDIQFLALVST